MGLNYRDHITHWKGVPLKELTRAALMQVIQYQSSRIRSLELGNVEISQLSDKSVLTYDDNVV